MPWPVSVQPRKTSCRQIDERINENQALRPEDRELIIEAARSALPASGLSASNQASADEVSDGSNT